MSERLLLGVLATAISTVSPFCAEPLEKGPRTVSEIPEMFQASDIPSMAPTRDAVDTVAHATLSTLGSKVGASAVSTSSTPVEVASSIDTLEQELVSPETLRMSPRKYAEWKVRIAPLVTHCLKTDALQVRVVSLFTTHAVKRTQFLALSKVRNSRLRVYQNLLSDIRILEAPRPIYERWMWQVAPILAKGYKDPLIGKSVLKLFNEHITERATTEKRGIPEYKTMGKIEGGRIVKRPSIEYHNERTLHATYSRHFGYSSFGADASRIRERTLREAYGDTDEHMSEISPADAKAAHLYLKQLVHIDWDDPGNGCNLRCGAAEEALRALNISEDKIFVAHIQGGSLGAVSHGMTSEWGYHIAIGLELADGNRVVLDPTLAPEGPITVEDWAKRAQLEPQREGGDASAGEKPTIFDRRDERGDTVSLVLTDSKPDYYPEYEVQLHSSSRHYRTEYELTKDTPGVRWVNTVDLRDRVEMSPRERDPRTVFVKGSLVEEDI